MNYSGQLYSKKKIFTLFFFFQDLYCVRSDLGNLLKALGRLEEAKVCFNMSACA